MSLPQLLVVHHYLHHSNLHVFCTHCSYGKHKVNIIMYHEFKREVRKYHYKTEIMQLPVLANPASDDMVIISNWFRYHLTNNYL